MFNKEKYFEIIKNIPKNVKVIAATKGKDTNDIKEAIDSGINIIGESYVQEAENKFMLLKDILKEKKIKSHMIGHLQSNKAAKAVKIFDCIQTLDSDKLAETINKEAEKIGKKIEVMIEINFDENKKAGVRIELLPLLIDNVKKLNSLTLKGFMCIPKIGEEKDCFLVMARLKDRFHVEDISMGMSNDYLKAIKYGSTMIRIGTMLFGPRRENIL